MFSDNDVSRGPFPEGKYGQETVVSVRQQKLSAAIRDTHRECLGAIEHDDDNMTELTSRTDEEVVRDAFRVLDTRFSDTSTEEDDEIVWDPRCANLPHPTATMELTFA